MEILFRGKPINMEENWVYGGIVHQTDFYGDIVDRYFIIDGIDTQDYEIGYEMEVDKNTVGQYTGYKDSSGNKIFDGDIVQYDTIGKVTFQNGCYFLEDEFLDTIIKNYKTIVVGNIYEGYGRKKIMDKK